MISEQRTIDYKNGTYKIAGGIPKVCPDNIPDFFKQYHEWHLACYLKMRMYAKNVVTILFFIKN